MSITPPPGNQLGQNADEVKKIFLESAKIADLLAMPGVENIEFDPAQLRDPARPANL